MASVIVSIAMRNDHAYAISVFLMWVAGIACTVLVVLHVWRILASSACSTSAARALPAVPARRQPGIRPARPAGWV
jgi:hypothetical protein